MMSLPLQLTFGAKKKKKNCPMGDRGRVVVAWVSCGNLSWEAR